jgi:hypothetical protein
LDGFVGRLAMVISFLDSIAIMEWLDERESGQLDRQQSGAPSCALAWSKEFDWSFSASCRYHDHVLICSAKK